MPPRTTSRTTTHLQLPGAGRAPADKPETKGERTRAALIEAGCHSFLSQGYHGTSLRDIARAAGIALGGIYNYFDAKEDIFLAMLAERQPPTHPHHADFACFVGIFWHGALAES